MLVLLQDTVVALQALAKYAAIAYVPSEEVSVAVKSTENFQRAFNIESANRLVLQQEALPSIPGVYTVEASGQGCVYVQASRGPGERRTSENSVGIFSPQIRILNPHSLPLLCPSSPFPSFGISLPSPPHIPHPPPLFPSSWLPFLPSSVCLFLSLDGSLRFTKLKSFLILIWLSLSARWC